MEKEEINIFYPVNATEWRNWLEKNHISKRAVWLTFYTKASGKDSLTWSEAVDVALCFGWIDSKKIKIDQEMSQQFFSKRKAISTWSKINKEKVAALISTGLMAPAGYQSIETAKQNGSWTILDDVEALQTPEDLQVRFENNPDAGSFFLSLSRSTRKAILQWLVLARLPETRQRRICEIVELAARKKKPKHLQ